MNKIQNPIFCALICTLGFLMLLTKSYAQEGSFAPLNPAFLKYVELQEQKDLKNTSGEKAGFGYIPSPLQLNFRNFRYTKKSSVELPSRYDLRELGLVTPVKNQDPAGTCGTFATIACVESNWLVNGWGTFDLSEQNLATCHGFSWNYEGGEPTCLCAYLTRFSGPVLESDDPYNTTMRSCNAEKFSVPRYVLSSRFLPNDKDLIKETIMKYGGICN